MVVKILDKSECKASGSSICLSSCQTCLISGPGKNGVAHQNTDVSARFLAGGFIQIGPYDANKKGYEMIPTSHPIHTRKGSGMVHQNSNPVKPSILVGAYDAISKTYVFS